jgi:glycosyltransferase involved in cell wall biosynthesis
MGAVLYRRLRPHTRLVLWLNLSERTEVGRGRLRGWTRRAVLPIADAVFVNGESGSRYLQAMGVPKSSIHRLPYATDVERFGRLPLARAAGQAKRMLYVGQLIRRKGILVFTESLLDWLEAHPQEAAELTIVGDGELRPSLQALQGRYYASHGFLVMPTLADEWGIVVNEALAAGLPVLGSRYAQAAQEMIEPEACGWLFDPEDPFSLQAAIGRVLAAPAEAIDRMRPACRERAFRFAPDRLIGDLMTGLLGPDQGAAPA